MTDSLEQQDSDSRNKNPIGFILPFVVFMAVASRYPSIDANTFPDDIAVNSYFYFVIAQVILAIGLTTYFFRQYLNEFPFQFDIWGVITGVVGIVLWIGICGLGIEQNVMQSVGLGEWMPDRVGFNPFDKISDPIRQNVFLFFRFALLAAMVPLIEELFLRGWFVRWWEDTDWQNVKLSSIGSGGIIAVAVYGLATHPGEAIAAVVWFTLVSYLMIKTGKFWNCVVAHAVTNLLLGIYVVYFEQWHLW